MSIKKEVIDFWKPTSREHAVDLIIGKDSDWREDTVTAVRNIFSPDVQKNLPGKYACLEIGCGMGRLLKEFANYFEFAVGVDITEEMAALGREYLKNTANAEIKLCDGEHLDFPENSFDFVYSYICFQHLQSYDEVRNYLKESYKILRPGGVIRVQTHCGDAASGFQGMHGAYYPSLNHFTWEFNHAGFGILEDERGITHKDSLWVTGRKV